MFRTLKLQKTQYCNTLVKLPGISTSHEYTNVLPNVGNAS